MRPQSLALSPQAPLPGSPAASVEQCIEVNLHVRQRDRPDRAALIDHLRVAAVRLASPGRYCPMIGMDEPDFGVASPLVLGHLGMQVIPSGRARPYLHHEWQRFGICLQPAAPLFEVSPHDGHRYHKDIWNEEVA